MQLLTNQQITDLASFLLDESGPHLDDDQLVDQIGQLLEDVSGFETASETVVSQYINEIRSAYYECCHH